MTKKSTAGFLIAIAMMATFYGIGILANALGLSGMAAGILITIVRYSLGMGGIISMTKLYGTDFRFRGKDVLKGIFSLQGVILMVFCLLNAFTEYVRPEIGLVQAIPGILLMIIYEFATGFFEEALFRGTLFNTFKKQFGEDRKGVLKAIAFSSIIFGAIHITNLITQPTLIIATSCQILYAIGLGIIFACAYYITNNIWVAVIMHGLFDAAGSFWSCFVDTTKELAASTQVQDISILEGAVGVAGCMIFAAVGLFLLFREFGKRKIAA